MTAQEKIKIQLRENKHITVGLDTDISRIPLHLHSSSDPVFEFNKIIIDNTYEYAAAFKINFAFYEKEGAAGFEALARTLEYIPKDILLIGDAKRGDIGNTSSMYAYSVFNHFGCDAVTLHPYMGIDSLQPFLDYTDKLHFILALTSNPGASDFEKLRLQDGSFLFQHIIKTVSDNNINKNLGIVFGATKKVELEENISLFDDLFVLLPGVGAQGGSLEDVASIFKNNNNDRFLVNVSRSILYKDSTENFGRSAKQEILSLNQTVDKILNS